MLVHITGVLHIGFLFPVSGNLPDRYFADFLLSINYILYLSFALGICLTAKMHREGLFKNNSF